MQDLAPPDSVVRPTKPTGAASNSSGDVQQGDISGRVAAAAKSEAEEPAGVDRLPAGKAAECVANKKQKGSKVASRAALAASEGEEGPIKAKGRGNAGKATAESERSAELKQAANSKNEAGKVAFDAEEVPADAELRGAARRKTKAGKEVHDSGQVPEEAKQGGAAKVRGKEAKAAAVGERGDKEVEPRAASKGKDKVANAASQETQTAPKTKRVTAGAHAQGAATAASETLEAATHTEMKSIAAAAAAGRPHRNRGSKQPYWLAQVCLSKSLHKAYTVSFLFVCIKTGSSKPYFMVRLYYQRDL